MRFVNKAGLVAYISGTPRVGKYTVLTDESQSDKTTEYYWNGSALSIIEDDDTSGVIYSVNTGRITDDLPDILYEEDDGYIKVYATDSVPLVLTYPNNTRDRFTSSLSLDVSYYHDGDYVLLYEKNTGLVAVNINDIVEQVSEPSTYYWLNISNRPFKSYKRINSVYTECLFVKLGQFTLLSGVVGDVISYAYNGYSNITVSVTINNTYRINHNIGSSALYFGTFDNISGVSDETNVPTGTGGYQIGVGLFNGNIVEWYYSSFVNYTNTTVDLLTGVNGLFHTSQNNGWFASADATVIFRRSF